MSAIPSNDDNKCCGTVKGSSAYEVKKCDVSWTVDHFSKSHASKMESPTFTVSSISNTKWKMVMNPVEDGHLSLGLELVSRDAGKHKVNVKFSIIQINGPLAYTQAKEAEDAELIVISPFVKVADVISMMSSGLLSNDQLTVHAEMVFTLENASTPITVAGQPSTEANDGLQKLSSDFKILYEKQAFTDITLCAAGKEYQLHRCILSARSPVLYKMLKLEMEGKVQNFMEINNVERPVVEAMIEYFYTGKLENLSPDLMLGLYSVAYTYRLDDLLRICRSFLRSNLSSQSVCDILIVAEGHDDSELKNLVVDYIISHFCEVFGTTEWSSLTKNNPTLAVGILSRCFLIQMSKPGANTQAASSST